MRLPEIAGRQDTTAASCSQGLGAVRELHGGSRAESSHAALSHLHSGAGVAEGSEVAPASSAGHFPEDGDEQRPGLRTTTVRHGPGHAQPGWGAVPWPDMSTAVAQLEAVTPAMQPRQKLRLRVRAEGLSPR